MRGERVSGGIDDGRIGGRAVKSPGYQAPAGQTTRSLMSFCAFILATPPPPPGRRSPLRECVLFVYTRMYIYDERWTWDDRGGGEVSFTPLGLGF